MSLVFDLVKASANEFKHTASPQSDWLTYCGLDWQTKLFQSLGGRTLFIIALIE